jgi:hypothetical protein
MLHRILRAAEITLAYVIFAALFNFSSPPLTDRLERIRAFTRAREFNYITWTIDAALLKLQAGSVGLPHSLPAAARKRIVGEYFATTQLLLEQKYRLESIYSDPAIEDRVSASADLRAELSALTARQQELAPLAEAILQSQVSEILAELELTTLGQPIPGVLFHSTPLPFALIVSPRERIEQIANISLSTDLPVDEQDALETRIDARLDTSSLVVPIGGIGVYPTMVLQSTDLSWLLNTIAHEWIHNYLTLRPLGILYTNSPELRTMNETAASIAGDEIGALVLERYYPELARHHDPAGGGTADSMVHLASSRIDHPQPGDFLRPPFDFRAEMHETRVTADALLSKGEIEEAETYMETRRLVFLAKGYQLRKLNQAYFAFYGAYADTPGGAAGEDPVGPAVRALRARSKSLTEFIETIAWMRSFEELQAELNP